MNMEKIIQKKVCFDCNIGVYYKAQSKKRKHIDKSLNF